MHQPEPSLGERAAALRVQEALFGSRGETVTFDRYEVIRLVGRGAFGSVYQCHDPKLGRDVALKIFESDDEALIREAQVMATVTHPNIAAIYDAGIAGTGEDARVYIAMELVVGMSLRSWQEQDHSSEERLAILSQAGQGLSAAHAAGIVHLDFKPDNVLVGDDGRVRVIDFGLSSLVGHTATLPLNLESKVDHTTRTVVGTPAYMAAEQFSGEAGTKLSDQFAFCVTAWEVLYGQRPFVGKLLTELRRNLEASSPKEIAGRGVPNKVKNALLVGLRADPNERHPSLEQLLSCFETRKKSGKVALAMAGLAVAAGVTVGSLYLGGEAAAKLCVSEDARVQNVWGAKQIEAAGNAFGNSGRSSGEQTWSRTRVLLDSYAQGWKDRRVDACEATHVRKEQTPETLELRMACFDDHLREFRALVQVFAEADTTVVDRAVLAVYALPASDDCDDPSQLRGKKSVLDEPTQRKLDALREDLARSIVLHRVGKGQESLAIAQKVSEGAANVPDVSLQAKANIWIAESRLQLGNMAEASEAARNAFDLALKAENNRDAVHATAILAFAGMHDSRMKEESLKWVETGLSLVGRIKNGDVYEAQLANAAGNSYLTANEAGLARPYFEQAVTAFKRIDPAHPNIGASMAMIGISYLQEGDLLRARNLLTESVDRTERSLGQHPSLASAKVNLSLVITSLGDYKESEKLLREAAALQVETHGQAYPLLVYTRLNLGVVLMRQGRWQEAQEEIKTSLAISEASFGPGHPLTAQVLVSQSEVLAWMGKEEDSIRTGEKALKVLQLASDGDSIETSIAYAGLALVNRLAKNLPTALENAKRGMQLTLPAGDDDPRYLLQSYEWAEALLLSGEREQAKSVFAKLMPSFQGPQSDPRYRALIGFGIARCLAPSDMVAAIKSAKDALAVFPKAGAPQERQEIEQWIASHSAD